MIAKTIKNEKGNFLKLPYLVGDEVYIGTTIDWKLGVVQGVISDIEVYWSKKLNDFYFRFYVEHKHIYSKQIPSRVVNRYVFFEGEIGKTYEEAKQKILDMESREKNREFVNGNV